MDKKKRILKIGKFIIFGFNIICYILSFIFGPLKDVHTYYAHMLPLWVCLVSEIIIIIDIIICTNANNKNTRKFFFKIFIIEIICLILFVYINKAYVKFQLSYCC